MREYVDNENDNDNVKADVSSDNSENDFDADMEIVSDLLTTEVTLAHASIGDYLRDETETKTISVGVDINHSHSVVTITLMSILFDKDWFEEWKNTTLASYACSCCTGSSDEPRPATIQRIQRSRERHQSLEINSGKLRLCETG